MGSSPHPPPPEASTTVATSAAPERAGHAFVLIVKRGTSADFVPVAGDEVVIGRGAPCDLAIDDPSVSRSHARLRFETTITLEDLKSRNGTFVDGERLEPGERREIEIGAQLVVGSVPIFLQRATLGDTRTARPKTRDREPRSPDVVIEDAAMRKLYAVLGVIAKSPLRVLVLGETGVGKEVYARALHDGSSCAKGPYLTLNCAAIPESILEAELFGYEKGAFTGAIQAKPGLFEAATGGTVFLDEVGELPLTVQAKLLRVLEGGEVTRLGALKPKKVDVRFVSATNRDLRALVADGRFRSDLYFRLNGTTVTVPPLRQRVAEIRPLARLFADRVARSLGRPAPSFDEAAIAALERHAWPGNVRELKNVVDRAVVMSAHDVVRASDLSFEDGPLAPPPALASSSAAVHETVIPAPLPTDAYPIAKGAPAAQPLWGEVESIERQRIEGALAAAAGNQSEAARQLGIGRATLIRRLEQFGIARPRKGRE